MGYLMDRHGMMMLGKTPNCTCPICATEHEPELPHNLESLRGRGYAERIRRCIDGR